MENIFIVAQEPHQEQKGSHTPALEAPWRAFSETVAQQQTQIESRILNQDAFEDVFPIPEMNPSHAARF